MGAGKEIPNTVTISIESDDTQRSVHEELKKGSVVSLMDFSNKKQSDRKVVFSSRKG